MKVILILLIVVLNTKCYAQKIDETYDKFRKVGTLSLTERIKLEPYKKTGDYYFTLNIYRLASLEDTLYNLVIVANTYYRAYGEKGLETIILLDNTNTITLNCYNAEIEYYPGIWRHYLQYDLKIKDMIDLYNSESIEMKCYLKDGSVEGKFTKEGKKELNLYLKNYLLKDLI